jgi:hypothetical protein
MYHATEVPTSTSAGTDSTGEITNPRLFGLQRNLPVAEATSPIQPGETRQLPPVTQQDREEVLWGHFKSPDAEPGQPTNPITPIFRSMTTEAHWTSETSAAPEPEAVKEPWVAADDIRRAGHRIGRIAQVVLQRGGTTIKLEPGQTTAGINLDEAILKVVHDSRADLAGNVTDSSDKDIMFFEGDAAMMEAPGVDQAAPVSIQLDGKFGGISLTRRVTYYQQSADGRGLIGINGDGLKRALEADKHVSGHITVGQAQIRETEQGFTDERVVSAEIIHATRPAESTLPQSRFDRLRAIGASMFRGPQANEQ